MCHRWKRKNPYSSKCFVRYYTNNNNRGKVPLLELIEHTSQRERELSVGQCRKWKIDEVSAFRWTICCYGLPSSWQFSPANFKWNRRFVCDDNEVCWEGFFDLSIEDMAEIWSFLQGGNRIVMSDLFRSMSRMISVKRSHIDWLSLQRIIAWVCRRAGMLVMRILMFLLFRGVKVLYSEFWEFRPALPYFPHSHLFCRLKNSKF